MFSLKTDIHYIFSLLFFTFILPGIIVLLLHAPWLLPIFVFHNNPAGELGSAYISSRAFAFFSFADFSHSFSLLQPNWPENIFGKTFFLYPQYLFLPIIAFTSLLCMSAQKNKQILFFCFLGLVGIFLAKGANQPFGQINSWMFDHIPGFFLFRDSMKFYTLIAVSYMVLIPYSLMHITKYTGKLKWLPFFLFLFYWAYLISPALLGKLDKTLAQNQTVPQEYILLADYIGKQREFFRTLWIPRQERFSFVSNNHPAVEAQPLFNVTKSSDVIAKLQKENAEEYLQNLGIKYVIVPYDPYGEVFFKDRTYDKHQYRQAIYGLRKLRWLTEIKGFRKIFVFRLEKSNTHFSLSDKGTIESRMIQPDDYSITITTKQPTKMVFVEHYNASWVAKFDQTEIISQKTKDGLNSFYLPALKAKTIHVFFKQKEILQIGWYICGATVLTISVLLILLARKPVYNLHK